MNNHLFKTDLLNKGEYFDKFHNDLLKKKTLNKTKKDIYNMSIKRPIPIDIYDYTMFNIIPNVHKELFIKDLNKINKRYLYKYLIGKIVSKLFWDDYIYLLIQDKNNDIIAISIYHFENEWYPLQIEILEKKFLIKEKYLLIINPFFTYEHYEEILCLTTNEFIIFNNYEDIIKFIKLNNEQLNENNIIQLGNLMFDKKLYEKSIYYYKKAIKILEKNKNNYSLLELLYKISSSYFNYGYYTKVIYYCDNALKLIKNNLIENTQDLKQKIFYIKLQGLICLRKYKESFQFYEEEYIQDKDIKGITNLKENSKSNAINGLLQEIISKKVNQNGIYNFAQMIIDEEKYFYLNYGDYISPKIEIDFDKEKGLKLICKKNNFIKKGELIIVEKALVSKKNDDNLERKKIIGLNINENYKKEEPYQNLEMTNELMEKIKKYKEDYEIFFILYDEDNRYLSIEERKKKYMNGEEKRIGFEKVKKIIDYSKYSAIRNVLYENTKGFGLWGYTSILNHSCNPNINNFSIGDFMICFAIKDISEGEELNTLYFNNSYCYSLRQEKCWNNWGFKCNCEICIYDKININNHKKKFFENSLKEFYEIGNNRLNHKNININDKYISFEKFIIENKKELSSFDLAKGYLQLIKHYGVLNDFNKCKELSEILSVLTQKYNYYSFEIENLNILFEYFGFKDKNIFDYLIKRYEIFIVNNTPLNKDDFNILISHTIK